MQLFRFRSPFRIEENEELGRALFSGNYDKKKKKINAGAFMPSKTCRGLSVNRLLHAAKSNFICLSRHDAEQRSLRQSNQTNFYGFAVVSASDLHEIELDDSSTLEARASITMRNPLHADLVFPPDMGKDVDLDIADQLLQIAQLQIVTTAD